MSILPPEEWAEKLAEKMKRKDPTKPFGTERPLPTSTSKLASIASKSDAMTD